MVKKWIKGFLDHPVTILKSIYYKILHKNENLATLRLNICNNCEDKKSYGVLGDICNNCGCILENKCRIYNEQCDKNKW